MDSGFHPEEDLFYARKLIEEIGPDVDQEQDAEWTKRDARQLRFVTRWGTKFVLDDRGSDPVDAETNEVPRANGWLQKTRRSWTNEPSIPRGFGFEAVDKDELNTSRWYSPKSKIVELNDRLDYVLMCTDTEFEISREWQKLRENEFALMPAMADLPENDTYHLKLDKHNGYLRLKTAAGGDNQRRGEPFELSIADIGLNQGLEARDGRFGTEGPWTEVVDLEHRGMWLSKGQQLGIWRSKEGKDQFIMINDGNSSIIIRNNEDGPIQIFCQKDIEIIAGENLALKAGAKISLKAGTTIEMEAAGSGHAKLSGNAWTMDVQDNAPQHTGFLPGATPGEGAQSDTGGSSDPLDPQPINQDKREPEDRGASELTADEVLETVITGCQE
jgi:hypothetical protein